MKASVRCVLYCVRVALIQTLRISVGMLLLSLQFCETASSRAFEVDLAKIIDLL
jgi:hypothetical protein